MKDQVIEERERALKESKAEAIELRRQLDRAEESGQYFQVIAETLTDVVFTATSDGAWDYVNGRFYEITGMPIGSALGEGWIQALHPDDLGPVAREFEESRFSKAPLESNYRLRSANGSYRRFLAQARPVRNADGHVARWVGIATDVHDLLAAEDALHQMGRRQEEFLSKLVHDLRNLLGPIQNAVEIMRFSDSTAAQRQRAIQIIEIQVRELRLVLDSLQNQRTNQAKGERPSIPKRIERHVLIVANDDEFAQELGLLLRVAGNDVRTIHGLQDALCLQPEFKPHVMVLDISLVGLAVDMTQRVRNQPGWERVLIVGIGEREADRTLRAGDFGCDAVLTKPVKMQDFLSLIAEQK